MQFDLSPEDIKVFLDEAEEVIQLLDEGILRLEQEGGTEEVLQDIFRAAHTLKGSSATLGHTKMAELTHCIENVFEKLRNDEITVTSGMIDHLLTALDVIKKFKEDIAADKESVDDINDMVGALSLICDAIPKTESQEQEAGSKADQDDFIDIVAAEEIKGNQILTVNVKLADDCVMPAVRMFQIYEEVANFGKILKTVPDRDSIAAGECGLDGEAIVSTQESELQILSVLNSIPDIANVRINKYSASSQEIGDVTETESDPGLLRHSVPSNDVEAEVGKQDASAGKQPDTKVEETKKPDKAARTIRVDVERLDKLMNLVGELVISRTQLNQIGDRFNLNEENHEIVKVLNETSMHFGKITNDLQEEIVKARMLPIERVFNKFPRMVRDLARRCEKDVDFTITGKETELDRSVIEEIGDPLIHILRNAIDHGIESPEERAKAGKEKTARVNLGARHQEGQILIEVTDDGRGIDTERLIDKAVESGVVTADAAARMSDYEATQLIFYSGISTAKEVTHLSGRGVGMDIVRANIEKLNGTIEVISELGKGSKFTIKLPLTLAIVQALLVTVSNKIFAIPLGLVTETIRLVEKELKFINKKETLVLRGIVLPLLRLADVFSYEKNGHGKNFVVIVSYGGNTVGLVVDELVGEQEIVVKTLGNYITSAKGISGATILGDGRVALIVDVPSLVDLVIKEQSASRGESDVKVS